MRYQVLSGRNWEFKMNTFYNDCDTSLKLRMDYDKGIRLMKEEALA